MWRTDEEFENQMLLVDALKDAPLPDVIVLTRICSVNALHQRRSAKVVAGLPSHA